jgi:hypothetical protein
MARGAMSLAVLQLLIALSPTVLEEAAGVPKRGRDKKASVVPAFSSCSMIVCSDIMIIFD